MLLIWTFNGLIHILSYQPLVWILITIQMMTYNSTKLPKYISQLKVSLAIFLVLIWCFYAILFKHCHNWYFHTSIYATAVLVGLFLSSLPQKLFYLVNTLNRISLIKYTPLFICIIGFLFAIKGIESMKILPMMNVTSYIISNQSIKKNDNLMISDKGKKQSVFVTNKTLTEILPAGTKVGDFDSGMVGWNNPELCIINLDGVANNSAYRALRNQQIGQYMLDEHIDWLLTNDRVVRRFKPFGLEEWLNHAALFCYWPDGNKLYRLYDQQ